MMILKIAQLLRCLHREEKGFTLIELLVVIAILGVLAAIAVPLVSARIEEARGAANTANLSLLQKAVELYRADTGVLPAVGAAFQTDLVTQPANVTGWKGPYIREAVSPPAGYGDYTMSDTGVVSNAVAP
jgi:type II secretion system protein G